MLCIELLEYYAQFSRGPRCRAVSPPPLSAISSTKSAASDRCRVQLRPLEFDYATDKIKLADLLIAVCILSDSFFSKKKKKKSQVD